MPRLLVQHPEKPDVACQVVSSPFTIGRRPDNDLVLDDRTVSRYHARLSYDTRSRCWEIINLSRTNPVLLRGRVVEKPTALFDGDTLQIGIYTVRFLETE